MTRRIYFATPCYRSDPREALDWAARTAASLGLPMMGDAPVSPFLAVSQAQCVDRFLASDCSHYFSREDDIFVEATVLTRMLASASPAIVAPYYVRGTTRFETVLGDDGVAWAGLGCTLLRRDVLEALWAAHWDELHFRQDGRDIVHLFRDLFLQRDDGVQLLKGDHAFWWRVRALGYRVDALDDVTVNHAGQVSRYLSAAAIASRQAAPTPRF